jgi:hypothetical protein
MRQVPPELFGVTRPPGGAWAIEQVEGLDARVALPELDITLPLAVLYAGLTFRPRPRLLPDDGGDRIEVASRRPAPTRPPLARPPI